MRGVGRASGAITIVNALPTGIGCALGIGLYVDAEVTLTPAAPGSAHEPFGLIADDGVRTPLVETAVRFARRRYSPDATWTTELRLRSEIPPARGLKSSSAVASAIVRAVATAAGAAPSDIEVARLAAEIARAAGLSATGAFDDALAGLSSGFVVTDNTHDELLRTGTADPAWSVALYVPRATHAPSPGWSEEFRRAAADGRRAATASLRADWWTAMDLNSDLVERTMGYDYAELRRLLRELGALGVGVSGLGPSLAVVAPTERIASLEARLPTDGGERRIVGLRPPSTGSVRGPR